MTLTQSLPAPLPFRELARSDAVHAPDRPPPEAAARPNEATSHLLRLVLDLQLDALLLAVGGSGVDTATVPAPDGGQAPEGLPWARWAAEDSAVARGLCAETISRGAALPSGLAQGLPGGDVSRVLEQLIARYRSMRDLLTEAISGRRGERQTPAELVRAGEALAHCRSRLAELRDLQETSPAQDACRPARGSQLSPGRTARVIPLVPRRKAKVSTSAAGPDQGGACWWSGGE